MTSIESVEAEIAGDASVFPLKTSSGIVLAAAWVGIVGSRDYPEVRRVAALVDLLDSATTIVSGGARGVDTAAVEAAKLRGLGTVVIRPGDPGQIAGYFARNTAIVRSSDVVVAFWDGASSGTEDAIRKALKFNGAVVVALPREAPQVWVPRINVTTQRGMIRR